VYVYLHLVRSIFLKFLWLVPDREICVNFWCSEKGNFSFSVIFCPQFLSNKFNFLLRILLFIIIISLFIGTVNMKLLEERRVFIHVKETFSGEPLLIQMLIVKDRKQDKRSGLWHDRRSEMLNELNQDACVPVVSVHLTFKFESYRFIVFVSFSSFVTLAVWLFMIRWVMNIDEGRVVTALVCS